MDPVEMWEDSNTSPVFIAWVRFIAMSAQLTSAQSDGSDWKWKINRKIFLVSPSVKVLTGARLNLNSSLIL